MEEELLTFFPNGIRALLVDDNATFVNSARPMLNLLHFKGNDYFLLFLIRSSQSLKAVWDAWASFMRTPIYALGWKGPFHVLSMHLLGLILWVFLLNVRSGFLFPREMFFLWLIDVQNDIGNTSLSRQIMLLIFWCNNSLSRQFILLNFWLWKEKLDRDLPSTALFILF